MGSSYKYIILIYRKSVFFISFLTLYVTKFLFFLIRPRLIISYNDSEVRDGFGAQFHRVLSLSYVAHFLNLKMIRPNISNLTLHPLDPFRDMNQLMDFMLQTNQVIFSSRSFLELKNIPPKLKVVRKDSLKIKSCFWLGLTSFFRRNTVLITSCEAHSISDLHPDFYYSSINFYFNELVASLHEVGNSQEIIIHYRQGPGNFVIYPGQTISRQLPINLFLNQLEIISKHTDISKFTLRVFTDAPYSDYQFTPPTTQMRLWENTPGFDGYRVTYVGNKLEELIAPYANKLGLKYIIDRDTDPFQMILQMARSPILLLSRSSLSYVAGLFNFGCYIYYAPSFWHSKPSNWLHFERFEG